MKRTILAVAGLFALNALAFAGDDGIAACEKVKNKAKRGKCFEAVAKKSQQKQDGGIESFVRQGRQRVVDSLSDPDSAKFRNLIVTEHIGSAGQQVQYLCGEVNAKNKFGGYTGFKKFVLGASLDPLDFSEPRIEGSEDTSDVVGALVFEGMKKGCETDKHIWSQS